MAKADIADAGKILLPVGGMDESIQVVDSNVTFARVHGVSPFYLATLQRLFGKKLIDANREQSVMAIAQAFTGSGQYGYYVQTMEKLYYHVCEAPPDFHIDFNFATTLGTDVNNFSLGIYGQRQDGTIPPDPGISCLFGFPDKPGPPPILGCTDPSANNYNPAATEDDGSCTYNAGWVYTGSMITARQSHTATLLPNGKVLVAGGYCPQNGGVASFLKSCELYDPETGTWAATGSLNLAGRYSHSAILMADGKVLLTGGTGLGVFAQAEVYDPDTEVWTTLGVTMARPRTIHSMTLLANGDILVVCGSGSNTVFDSQLFSSGVFGTQSFLTKKFNCGYDNNGAILLNNGKVLVATYFLNTNTTTVELWSPISGLWTLTGTTTLPRDQYVAILMPDGNVLLAGGRGPTTPQTSYPKPAEIYDTVAGTWSNTGSLTTGRYHAPLIAQADGTYIIIGGYGGSPIFELASTEIYDPDTGLWTVASAMNQPRSNHTATTLPNGRILVTGGTNTPIPFESTATCELYSNG